MDSSQPSTSGTTDGNSVDTSHIDETINAVVASSMLVKSSSSMSTEFQTSGLASRVSAPMSYGTPRSSQQFTDLPENLLENSSTPPLDNLRRDQHHIVVPPAPATTVALAHLASQSPAGIAPVFASLTPVVDSSGFMPSTTTTDGGCSSYELKQQHPPASVPSIRHLFSSTSALGAAANNGSSICTSLNNGVVATMPGYLAVKIDPHSGDVFNTSALNVVGAGATLLSPASINIGSIQGCNPLNFTTSMSSSSGDLLSFTPSAAVYVQPINQNGQLQFVKLNFPGNNGSPTSSAVSAQPTLPTASISRPSLLTTKRTSSVNTVDLASTLIATMLQEQETQQQQPQPSLSSSAAAGDVGKQPLPLPPLSLQQQIKMLDTRPQDVSAEEMSQVYVVKSNDTSKWNVLANAIDQDQEWAYILDNRSRLQQGQETEDASSRNGCVQLTPTAAPDPSGVDVTLTTTTSDASDPIGPDGAAKKRHLSPRQLFAPPAAASAVELGAALKAAAENDDADDDIFIDTRDLCNRIAYELKTHSIPQAVFAERVLCRSQGTLSDLLRNPKPWNKLKSGRETFRRMYYWLKMPLHQRMTLLESPPEQDHQHQLAALEAGGSNVKVAAASDAGQLVAPINVSMASKIESMTCQADISGIGVDDLLFDSELDDFDETTTGGVELSGGAAETAAAAVDGVVGDKDVNSSAAKRPAALAGAKQSQRKPSKRPRLVFTDIQKRTLQAIFKETQRPSREMQQTIAEHLGLDLSTVQNFFMNARRRSRIDQSSADASNAAPYPYQQIRTVTPPPASPSPPIDRVVRLDDDTVLPTPSMRSSSESTKRRSRNNRSATIDGHTATTRRQRGTAFSITVTAPPPDAAAPAMLQSSVPLGFSVKPTAPPSFAGHNVALVTTSSGPAAVAPTLNSVSIKVKPVLQDDIDSSAGTVTLHRITSPTLLSPVISDGATTVGDATTVS